MRKIQEIRQMQQQTELLRQQTEAIRQQNELLLAAPAAQPLDYTVFTEALRKELLAAPLAKQAEGIPAPAKSRRETFRTHGLLNGYFWLSVPDPAQEVKLLILTAYRDAVVYLAAMTTDDYAAYSKLQGRFFPDNYTAAMVDEFYAVPENMRIPGARVMQLLAAKAAGASAQEIRRQTEELRIER
jgi:hypothetical protein